MSNDCSNLTNDNLINCLKSCDCIYIFHPYGGSIYLSADYSYISISTTEFIANSSGSCIPNVYVCYYIPSDGACYSGLTIGKLSNVICSECGYSVECVDLSNIPIKSKIIIGSPNDSTYSVDKSVDYEPSLQGHLHKGNSYSHTESNGVSICNYEGYCSESPQQSPICHYMDYVGCIPDLSTSPSVNTYSNVLIDECNYVSVLNKCNSVIKSSVINDNKNSISRFCNCPNNEYKIYDGDLPLVDISLLCNSNESYKLSGSNYIATAEDKDSQYAVTKSLMCELVRDLWK